MVTYAAITHKVTLIGDMFGGAEEWSTGFFLGQTNGGDFGQPPTAAEAQAIAEAFRTAFIAGPMGISSKFRFLGCKISHVNTAGQSDAALTQYHWLPTPALGSNAASPFPPQIALVATLCTLKQRGFGSKGRMYLPGVTHSVTADGKMDASNALQISGLMASFLDAVNQNADVQGVVVLNSALSAGIPGHAAEMNPIASVRVGTVYDTQRRRRNALTEFYSNTPLPG